MTTDREDIASLATRMANLFATKASAARVLGENGQISISDDACAAAAQGFHLTALAIRNLEARLAASEKRADEYAVAMTQGLALIGYLRSLKFKELLAWWLKQRDQQKKGTVTC